MGDEFVDGDTVPPVNVNEVGVTGATISLVPATDAWIAGVKAALS